MAVGPFSYSLVYTSKSKSRISELSINVVRKFGIRSRVRNGGTA